MDVTEWEDWSNSLADMLPEEYDGDEAQEAIIERFIRDALVWREAVAAAPQREVALRTVCAVAFEWAGEYGFSNPERASKVWAAAAALCPELVPVVGSE